MSESLKSKTVHGMKWSAIERFSTQGVQLVIQILLARLLLPRDYGIIAMLAIFIALSETFINSGFSQALIRKLDRDEDDFTTTFIFNLGVALFFYGLLFWSAPFIAEFYGIALLTPIMRMVGLVVVLNALFIVQQTILMIRVDFKRQTMISLVAVLVSGGIALFLALQGFGAWALAWQLVIAAFIRAVLFWIVVGWRPKGRFSRKSFVSLFGFGSKLLLSGILDTLYMNIYLLVIGKVYAPRVLGFFAKAKELATYPAMSFTNIVHRVTYPVLSEMQHDNERLTKAYRELLRLLAFVFFPLMVGLAAVADPLVRLLLTDKWENCIVLLQVLCFAMMWYPIHTVNLSLLQVKGRSDLFLRLDVYKKGVATLVLLSTLPLGLMALCLGLVLNSLVELVLNTGVIGRFIKVGLWVQLKDMLFTLLGCALMFGAITLVNLFLEGNVLKLVVDVVLGVVVYVGLAVLRGAEELKLLKKIFHIV